MADYQTEIQIAIQTKSYLAQGMRYIARKFLATQNVQRSIRYVRYVREALEGIDILKEECEVAEITK